MGRIPAPLERDDVRGSKLAELAWSEPHKDCRLGPVVDADHLASPLEPLDLRREELAGFAGAESHEHRLIMTPVEADNRSRAAVRNPHVIVKQRPGPFLLRLGRIDWKSAHVYVLEHPRPGAFGS